MNDLRGTTYKLENLANRHCDGGRHTLRFHAILLCYLNTSLGDFK